MALKVGRKKKKELAEHVHKQFEERVYDALRYIMAVNAGEEKPSKDRLDSCWKTIWQCDGKPTQRTELSGAKGKPIEIIEIKATKR